MKKGSFLIVMLFAGGIAYAHGLRIVTIAELPSSQRPWSVMVTGGL